ncbi:MAG: hypothetical protein ACRCUM_03980 [Mycoplasmoidaceae bacterium]
MSREKELINLIKFYEKVYELIKYFDDQQDLKKEYQSNCVFVKNQYDLKPYDSIIERQLIERAEFVLIQGIIDLEEEFNVCITKDEKEHIDKCIDDQNGDTLPFRIKLEELNKELFDIHKQKNNQNTGQRK